jgi:hypothetical protein
MARATIAFGLGLCIATVAILLGLQQQRLSEAFIPMIFGIPIFICGVISLNPHRRRTWLRFASALAWLGSLGGLVHIIGVLLRWNRELAIAWVPAVIIGSLAGLLLAYAVIFQKLLKKPNAPQP